MDIVTLLMAKAMAGSGGGSGGGGVTSWDKLKNRPFYEKTIPGINIEWDGNTEGHTVIDLSPEQSIVKVSDELPTDEQLIGSTIVAWEGDKESKIVNTQEVFDQMVAMGGVTEDYTVLNSIMVVRVPDCNLMGMVTVPEPGTYFASMFGGMVYIKSLTNDSKIGVKHLDSKFIKDMYYEEVLTKQVDAVDLHFDGNKDGMPIVTGNNMSFIKVSDSTITVDQVINSWIVACLGEENESMQIPEEAIYVPDENAFFIADCLIAVILSDSYSFEGVEFTSPGVYFADVEQMIAPGAYIVSLTRPDETVKETIVHKVNEKYIPDMNALTLKSTSNGSKKIFNITVDDSGTPTATDVETGQNYSFKGKDVSFSRNLTSGTQIGTITIGGSSTTIYAPKVSFSRNLTSGTQIGTITIDGSSTTIYAPKDLPKVTAANNGAFLRVVNGTWAAATLLNAEGATF